MKESNRLEEKPFLPSSFGQTAKSPERSVNFSCDKGISFQHLNPDGWRPSRGWMRWGIISQSLLEKLIPWKQVLHSLCQIQNVTDNEMMVQIMSNYLTNIALVNTKHYSTSKPLNTLHVPDAVTQPVIRVTLNKNLYLLTLIVYWVTGKLNNTGTTTLTFLFLCWESCHVSERETTEAFVIKLQRLQSGHWGPPGAWPWK